MKEKIINELRGLKTLSLLAAKDALSMDDAVLLTGMSKSYLYKMVSAGKIPHYKSAGGKFTYFRKEDLNAWMLHYRVPTADEIASEATTYVAIGKLSKESSGARWKQ